jgi:hypothetical protein
LPRSNSHNPLGQKSYVHLAQRAEFLFMFWTRPVLVRHRDGINMYDSMISERRWWRKYDRYLDRRDWRRTRKAVLKRDRFGVRNAAEEVALRNSPQANHLSYSIYNTTGRTPLRDLETLCRELPRGRAERRFKNRHRRAHHLLAWAMIITGSSPTRSSPRLNTRKHHVIPGSPN